VNGVALIYSWAQAYTWVKHDLRGEASDFADEVSGMGRFLLFLLVLLLPLSTVTGQNIPQPQLQPRPTGPPVPATAGTNQQITIDVQVTDKSGAPIRGLQKQDFTLLDDKQPQNILSFRAVDGEASAIADPPAEIVLVVDAVNASPQAVAYEREAIKKFLLRDGGKLAHPVSLVVFADSGTKIQNGSSRDGNALAAQYDQYETGLRSINRSQGFYGATERYDMSLKTLMSFAASEAMRPGRKLMIWISPGWPLLTGPDIELSGKDGRQIFGSIVSASTMLRQARITLYSIDPLGLADAGGVQINYYEEFLKGVSSPSRAVPADLSLQVLAVQSGGGVLNSSNDLTNEITNCVADADAFYVLSFNPSPPDRADEYHAITIKVEKPGVKIRTRSGYYAQF
jgi:VWFA-related protein